MQAWNVRQVSLYMKSSIGILSMTDRRVFSAKPELCHYMEELQKCRDQACSVISFHHVIDATSASRFREILARLVLDKHYIRLLNTLSAQARPQHKKFGLKNSSNDRLLKQKAMARPRSRAAADGILYCLIPDQLTVWT